MKQADINPGRKTHSLSRLLAMFFSPLALPKPHPICRGMSRDARKKAKRANQRFVQIYLRGYIDRSAKIVAVCMAAYLFSIYLVGHALLVVVVGVTMLAAFLHLAALLFWKQHLDDRLGPVEPPE